MTVIQRPSNKIFVEELQPTDSPNASFISRTKPPASTGHATGVDLVPGWIASSLRPPPRRKPRHGCLKARSNPWRQSDCCEGFPWQLPPPQSRRRHFPHPDFQSQNGERPTDDMRPLIEVTERTVTLVRIAGRSLPEFGMAREATRCPVMDAIGDRPGKALVSLRSVTRFGPRLVIWK